MTGQAQANDVGALASEPLADGTQAVGRVGHAVEQQHPAGRRAIHRL